MRRRWRSVLSLALVALLLFTNNAFVTTAEELQREVIEETVESEVELAEEVSEMTEASVETVSEEAPTEVTTVEESESIATEAATEEVVTTEAVEEETVTEETTTEDVTSEITTEEITTEETVTEEITTEEVVTEEITTEEITEEITEEATTEQIDLSEFGDWIPEDEMPDNEGHAPEVAMFRLARNIVPEDGDRYTVLVIDVSGSMRGTPMQVAKQAASKFCESVLQAEGTNYVALVSYDNYSYVGCNFTNDLDSLQSAIDVLYANGGTNIATALDRAGGLLETVTNEEATKNIVLLSDGLPEHGIFTRDGKYSRTDHSYSYGYANTAYNEAIALHESTYLYTLGFFHSLRGVNLEFGQRFMKDIQNAGYYEVTDASKLEFTFGEIAEEIKALKKTGTFKYSSDIKKEHKDYTATYYYDDAYFTKSAYDYNSSLATMSICLAMSAFGSNETRQGEELGTLGKDYATYSRNVEALLTDVGFEQIQTNEYFNAKPEMDSIGVIAANKKLKSGEKTYTLIAVAVRGAGYEAEWSSNLTLGTYGEHQGFKEAKENVLAFLGDYIEQQEITGDVKLWITGYSRAAATTNLTAAALDKDAKAYLGEAVTLAPEDLYAYCFETPMGTLTTYEPDAALYQNIHSRINVDDPVPKVAMSALGFEHYGNVQIFPTPATNSLYASTYPVMKELYESLDSTKEYTVDQFKMKKISITNLLISMGIPELRPYLDIITDDNKNNWTQGVYLDNLMAILSKEIIKNRYKYVTEYQDDLRELCSIYFGSISSDPVKMEKFKDAFVDRVISKLPMLIYHYIMLDNVGILATVKGCVVDAANDAGITDYNDWQINGMVAGVVKLLGTIAVTHPNYTVTLVQNASNTLGAAHYPELCFAWLMSLDKNYTSNAFFEEEEEETSNGDYRIIHINCPVDVEVYDSKETLVAAIVNDEPQDIAGSDILASITPNGDKEIILPPNEAYTVKIAATDWGIVSYAIKEFSFRAGEVVRVMNYFDIPVETGDVLTAKVAKYSVETVTAGTRNGTDTEYLLFDKNGEELAPDKQLKGDEAKNAYITVDVTVNDSKGGVAIGGGMVQADSYVMVQAATLEGYTFDGWYVKDAKVSDEAEYRFRAGEDTTVMAKFSNPNAPENNQPDQPNNDSDHNSNHNSDDDSDDEESSSSTPSGSAPVKTEETPSEPVTEIVEIEVPQAEALPQPAVTVPKTSVNETVVSGDVVDETEEVSEATEEASEEVSETEEVTETVTEEAAEQETEEESQDIVILEDEETPTTDGNSNFTLYLIILIIVAILAGGTVLYLKNRKVEEK